MRRAATATGAPVLVTENGIAADDDTRRVEFVRQALHSVLDCLDDGLDVRGSTYWSLLDTFEWAHGYRPTFGLVAVDRTTQVRTPKLSAPSLTDVDIVPHHASTSIDIRSAADAELLVGRPGHHGGVLRAAGGGVAVRCRGRGDGPAVQGPGRSPPGQDRQPARRQSRPGVRVRVHRPSRAQPADGQPSPQEAGRRRAAGPRAARHLGLLLPQPRRPSPSRRCRQLRRSQPMTTQRTDRDAMRERVRARYAAAATQVAGGQSGCGCGQPADCGCDSGCCGPVTVEQSGIGAGLYADSDRDALPDAAVLASLGCGNPTAVAELRDGETVLDLGSGGGIDVLLSARRVGPTGKAYGLDMTEEMLALARANTTEAGATNVEWLKGQIEAIPLPAATIDVVISNCVVNLSTDKPAVFAESFRVLKPGGRIGITDVVAEDHLSAADRAERGAWVGCIAGALSSAEYRAGLAAVGFTEVSVTLTHQVGDGLHSAIVRAVKPSATSGDYEHGQFA